ncbi:MAG TPA: MFS transporter, partial [Caldimonas sp.]
MTEPGRAAGLARPLLALIGGQIALHSCMAGIRMASPLAALREGHAAWAVGVLLGLFATAPIVLALPAGRLADRYGYHVPIRVAVGLTVSGGIAAIVATLLPAGQFFGLCV